MDDPTEHQRRWTSQKAQWPAEVAAVDALKAGLAASLDACQQVLGGFAEKLRSSRSFSEMYDAVERFAEFSRVLARIAHSAKYTCDWETAPIPEFNDHYINQYFLWPELKRSFWLEGPVITALAMKRGGRYLELCCGSGFNSDLFYSAMAGELVAVDFDPRAIELARRYHARDNVRYEVLDIRAELPAGPFDGIIWDAAIEHFTAAEIAGIVGQIFARLAPGALLSGYTVSETDSGRQHPDHEHEFRDMADLGAHLKPPFRHVRVFESVHTTIAPARRNLMFFAGNDTLPFDAAWPHGQRL
jgi:SAM-dependent methyltransferase